MNVTKLLAGGVFAVSLSVGTAQAAAIVDLIVEGGGTPQVYALESGDYVGLWGFDNRSSTSDVTLNSEADLLGGFTSGAGNIVGFLDTSGADFSFPFTVDAGQRLFDSLWVQWTGGNLVYSFNGKSRTMGTGNAVEGTPFASVPEPGTLALFSLGLMGLVASRRFKRS